MEKVSNLAFSIKALRLKVMPLFHFRLNALYTRVCLLPCFSSGLVKTKVYTLRMRTNVVTYPRPFTATLERSCNEATRTAHALHVVHAQRSDRSGSRFGGCFTPKMQASYPPRTLAGSNPVVAAGGRSVVSVQVLGNNSSASLSKQLIQGWWYVIDNI